MMRWHRIRKWGSILSEYSAVQVIVQALAALTGLVIIRVMSKPEFALFAIVNLMQGTCNTLADLGIGLGVRSLGGEVWADRFRFGQLMNTALNMRHRFAIASFAICLPITWWMLWKNGAGPIYATALCAAVACSVLPLLNSSVWGASLGLHSEYRRLQKLDVGNASLRFLLIGTSALTRINAWLAAMTGVVGNWVQAFFQKRWAAEKADFTAPPNEDDRRELLQLSLRSLPNTVFFCFQGQITLLILTLVGSPSGIANIAALGRVAALFAVFSATFTNVLIPRFARCQEPAQLTRLYLLLVGGAALIVLPLAAFAVFLPGPFLWLLGGKYASLGAECGWVVGASCISQLCSVLWSLNCSKAWIRVQAIAFIPAVLGAQAVAAMFLDLRQFHDVLILNLIATAAPIPIYLVDSMLGLRKEHASERARLHNSSNQRP
jgi:O-antigen/teichoic acid export membrane protein